MTETVQIPCQDVRFVKELYPRLREDDAAIERYRAALDRLPPIVVARGSILVDGFHRWQAYRRESAETIPAEDLGNLSDAEILKESVKRNASHGRQLETRDKKRMADLLYRQGTRDEAELIELLSVAPSTLETYLRDARRDEKQAQQEAAWGLWLDCRDQKEIAELVGMSQPSVSRLIQNRTDPEMNTPPESRQHFDVWQFATADQDDGRQSYFGALPPQVVENLLWFYTEPGDVVVDLFAGSGTTVDVAKRMGRRVWASDIRGDEYAPLLPIHQHDATQDWPDSAPKQPDLIVLDPPYWRQATGRYSAEPNEFAEMDLDRFYDEWSRVVKTCTRRAQRVAFIISPTQLEDGTVEDHATAMIEPFLVDANWRIERRIIVPYSTQQATGQQVEWAREHKRMLKLYRDLVVMIPQ